MFPGILALATVTSAAMLPQDHDPSSDHSHTLHFSHPIVTESPSPDTKVRIDGIHLDGVHVEADRGDATTVRLEAEYAFHPSLSVEVNVPYTFLDLDGASSQDSLDNVEVGLKFANFAFADRGLLLGYGIEFGLPTGDDDVGIGSNNELEIAPFLDFGYMNGPLEVVGFSTFVIPTNQNGEEVESEMEPQLSFLYHANESLMALCELDGVGVLSGDEEGSWVVNLSPGLKLAPFAKKNLRLGLSVGFPLTHDEEFDLRVIGSLFYHL